MPRRMERAQTDALDFDRVAVANAHRDDVDGGLRPHHGDALRAVAERPHAAHVVGVDVGIEDLGERELELVEKGQVALDLLQHRIDDEGFAARARGDEVGVAARADVVELAEEHRPNPILGLPLDASIVTIEPVTRRAGTASLRH